MGNVMPRKIKNIAVIVSDIDNEYQNNIIKGIKKYSEEYDVNVASFIAFTGYFSNMRHDIGEYNIYNLINFDFFDGVILVTNTITSPTMQKRIFSKIRETGIPAVSINFDIEDFYSICIDNEKAMENIVRHFVGHHGCRTINYISGPLGNPESNQRINAYRRVLAEYGIPTDERRIFYGTFLGEDGPVAVNDFIKSGLPMPEVIICANDEMALTTILELQKQGYNVPNDIMVSGFDNIYSARTNSPKLTTVECPHLLSGYHACKIIQGHYDGINQPRYMTLNTTPIYSESCGCDTGISDDITEFRKKNFLNLKMYSTGVALINQMMNDITEAETFESNIEILKKYVLAVKCKKCYLCINQPDRRASGQKEDKGREESYLVDGYNEIMNPVIAYENEKFVHKPCFRSNEMLPEFVHSEEVGMYYFAPIHFQDRSMGYCVIFDSDYPIQSPLYYTWLMSIGISFENIRKISALENANTELEKLYVTDRLTGLYNRHGFSKFTKKLYQIAIRDSIPVMVMFLDMDGLKMINDTYGHNEGDFAITTICHDIRDLCHKGEICARLGGDEFVIFGIRYTEEMAADLSERIEKTLAEFNENSGKPYKLGTSAGWCIEVPHADLALETIINAADELMYEKKKNKKESRVYMENNPQ
jgi:diguanylate cyclase (GGDEF)-like protein